MPQNGTVIDGWIELVVRVCEDGLFNGDKFFETRSAFGCRHDGVEADPVEYRDGQAVFQIREDNIIHLDHQL